MGRKAHYLAGFDMRAARLRREAYADRLTKCWRCGGLVRSGDPWEAGHVRDGDPTSPLMPEHRSCNRRASARRLNDGDLETSRDWYGAKRP